MQFWRYWRFCSGVFFSPHTVEWLDALYLLGLRTHVLVHFLIYLLTYLHGWLGAYKTGNISETVVDRAKVTIRPNGLYKVVHWLSIAAKMYDLNDLWARFKFTDSTNAAKMQNDEIQPSNDFDVM